MPSMGLLFACLVHSDFGPAAAGACHGVVALHLLHALRELLLPVFSLLSRGEGEGALGVNGLLTP